MCLSLSVHVSWGVTREKVWIALLSFSLLCTCVWMRSQLSISVILTRLRQELLFFNILFIYFCSCSVPVAAWSFL